MCRRGQPRIGTRSRWGGVVLALSILTLSSFLTGCKSGTKTALIEAELRTREREIRTMRTELERAHLLNSALQYELAQRQDACAPIVNEGVLIDGPQSVLAGTVSKVLLGRGTGGIDDDGIWGDEALQVVIVPVDTDDSALKVPGKAVVHAQEITREGLKIPLCQWEVSPLELQRSWRSSLFSTGYFLTLPWKVLPSNERLRVVVQFYTLPHQRVFEAERDISIKLFSGRVPRSVPAPPTNLHAPPSSVPAPPPPTESIPPADGPILSPGAFRPASRTPSSSLQAAKPAFQLPANRVRLLTPILLDDNTERP